MRRNGGTPTRGRARTLRAVLAVGVLALTTGACSDSDDGANPAPTGASTTSTPTTPAPAGADRPTTTAPPVSRPGGGTTAPSTTTTAAPGAAQPEGSGCAVDGDTLPDGRWFGMVTSASSTGIEFDLACWFTGDAAVRAAAQDGEESPPPNDYYVRNQSTRTRSVTVDRDATVEWVKEMGDPTTVTRTGFGPWREARVDGFLLGVWLDVKGGTVHAITEQWVP